jgi:3-oxoacyl-[acyl-carrier protein] reductase
MPGRLTSKTAIVTGSGRGIGKSVAQVFAAEQASVLVNVAHDEAAAIRTVEEIKQAGGEASFIKADVTKWADMENMAKAAIDCYGRIDILVCNAGIYPSARIEDMTEEQWDEVNSVNLKGIFFAVKACLPQMKKQKYGRIVLTSSITGPITGFPGWAHYGTTKAGMLGFIKTAAIEFAKDNITINAVLCGNTRTQGLVELGEEYVRSMEASIPLGRLAEPEDQAYAMLFLASDEAKYITGQSLVVDGGQILPESSLALV